MFNYRLVDMYGKTLGVVSLETEELPKKMVEGHEFCLAIAFNPDTREISELSVVGKLKIKVD